MALALLVLAMLWGLPGLDGRLRVTASLLLGVVPLLSAAGAPAAR